MNKKVQLVILVLVTIALIALSCLYVINIVKYKTVGNVHPEVTFEIEGYGNVKMELYPEYAPNTVYNILKLVESGFYTDKVVYGEDQICMYVGRDAEGNVPDATVGMITDEIEVGSTDDYKYSIEGEFISNGYRDNTMPFEKGTVALLRNDYTQYVQTLTTESHNSGCSQIGIILNNEGEALAGAYAGFGKIVEGMDIIEKIYNEVEESPYVPAEGEEPISEEEQDQLIKVYANKPVIKSATVDKKGIDYPLPKVQEAFDYEAYLYDMFSKYYGNSAQ